MSTKYLLTYNTVTGELAVESLVQVWTVFFFYNGTAPAPGVFDEFNAIIPLLDQVRPQSYASFVSPVFRLGNPS